MENKDHYLKQFQAVAQLGLKGKEDIREDDIDAAICALRELSGRTESMLEDLEEQR